MHSGFTMNSVAFKTCCPVPHIQKQNNPTFIQILNLLPPTHPNDDDVSPIANNSVSGMVCYATLKSHRSGSAFLPLSCPFGCQHSVLLSTYLSWVWTVSKIWPLSGIWQRAAGWLGLGRIYKENLQCTLFIFSVFGFNVHFIGLFHITGHYPYRTVQYFALVEEND